MGMNCCQCQGIEELFNEKAAARELKSYRNKGPDKTTRMLITAIQEQGVEGSSLLDIGGGIGAIQHALLLAGVTQATDVDASSAYVKVARREAERRGIAERVRFVHGNFVELAEQIQPADIVTLDRVICCYPDMDRLVELSAQRARKLYGLVYPRNTWWVKIGLTILNFFFKLQKNPFRTFQHPSEAVETIVMRKGFQQVYHGHTLVWNVVLYSR
jgi:2-polyprenyl-3-methyl-5-hydroxy-6-metoxy-1,4-benzoquinol methylase